MPRHPHHHEHHEREDERPVVIVENVIIVEPRREGPAHRKRRYRLRLKNVQGPGSVAVSTRHRGDHG